MTGNGNNVNLLKIISISLHQPNQVKLKSPRPPQYQSQEKSQVIFNLIKRKQEKTDALQDILGSTDISVFPLSLKDKTSKKIDEGKSRQKRWVPFSPIFGGKKKKARSSQLPQKDNFLDFIHKKPSPFPVNRYDLCIHFYISRKHTLIP